MNRPYSNSTLAPVSDALHAADTVASLEIGLTDTQRAWADDLARRMIEEKPWIGWSSARTNALAVVRRMVDG